jgi:type II secretory pathway pseudopilin PulG
MNYQKSYNLSFSLVEVLIAITFIVVLSYLIYMGFINFMKFSSAVRIQLQALNLLENELEFIRNLKYEDVGIIGGYPRGKLEAKKIVEYGPYKFEVRTYVRNIDDPFDGTVTSTPKDIAPADYKLVELEADCLNCPTKIKTQKLTSIVAPKTLEATTKNGSLFIQVFDSLGKPVSLANVLVINNKINPPIRIEDLTNVNGLLQLIDIPTGTNAYEITVSKPGYSVDKTYPPN